jgi:hypothetical protein
MDALIDALVATGGGLTLRREVVAAGMSARQLDRLVRQGDLVVVRRGVYTTRDVWESLDEHVGRPRLRGRAVSRSTRTPHVLSHDSAAHELGLRVLGRRGAPVHLTREGRTGGRLEHGVKHHVAPYRDDQVVAPDGVPVLEAARTALDICREEGYRHGLVACDSALQAGVTRQELWATFEQMWCWPGSTAIRLAIANADPRAESVAETLGRDLVMSLGIGPVESQFVISDGHRSVRCDLRVGRHVFEIDGRIKYRRREEGGVAERSPEEVLWEEKLRQDFIAGFHLGTSRIVWADFWGSQRVLARVRLRREYEATAARFGTDIDDLSPYIVRAA